MNSRDKLFYEHAREALEDPDEESSKKPIIIILGLFAVLILLFSSIPFYFISNNPPPNKEVITNFQVSPEELSIITANVTSFSSIREAVANVFPEKYRIISVRLSTSACSSYSKLCYAKALFYYTQNNIQYINDPFSRQYVQLPEETLNLLAGDCDDKSVLLAALLESIGIDADVGVTSNHAFVRAQLEDAPFWIRKDSYVYLDPSSNSKFGEISFREEEIVRFYEIY